MTSIAVSRRAETSPLSVVLVAIQSLRHRRIDALQRKQLLGPDDHMLLLGLDHHILRDIGLERLNTN